MKRGLFSMVFIFVFSLSWGTAAPVAIAVHGGAGARSKMSNDERAKYEATLTEALKAGHQILTSGGSSLDAVEAAVRILEDSPLFNAGRGAVLTNEGKAELDASIMDGKTLEAGAIASVTHIKNPISLARLVLDQSKHVLLVGEGAEVFGREQGVDFVDNEYFRTKRELEKWKRTREEESKAKEGAFVDDTPYSTHGTVGAVALDQHGNLAAATSTGGMHYKRFGRVGDSPIIGAGTYADNHTCAVSATGHGEFFIRGAIAYDISAMMKYTGASLSEAVDTRIHEKLTKMGGTGGVIAIDREGNIAISYNTEGMYRGKIDSKGTLWVARQSDDSPGGSPR